MPGDAEDVDDSDETLAGRESARGRGAGATDSATTRAVGDWLAGAASAGLVAEVCRSVAPHMPQKRLVSGFSFPQRLQRTGPPDSSATSLR